MFFNLPLVLFATNEKSVLHCYSHHSLTEWEIQIANFNCMPYISFQVYTFMYLFLTSLK